MRLTTTHLIVLIVVVLLLFGANRLPGLARSLGQSLKIFKKEVSDLTGDGHTTPTTGTTAPGTSTTGAPVADADPDHGADVPPPPPAPPAPPRA